jgi:Tfp pilus assembly protein PilN
MININLLPPELKMQRIMAKRNASLIGICVVSILVFALLGIIGRSLESTISSNLNNAKNSTEQDSSQLNQYQDQQDLALLINDRWQETQKIEANRVYWSQALQELSNSVPTDVQVESLVIDSEKTPNFVLTGNTTSDREVIKFKDKLESSSFFKNVSFKSSGLSNDQTTTQVQSDKIKFTLEFDLEQKKIDASTSGGQ